MTLQLHDPRMYFNIEGSGNAPRPSCKLKLIRQEEDLINQKGFLRRR